jgi:hypothetical protein
MSTSTNGRLQRNSLSHEIDRLNLILDGLADGLQEAVAMAVKEAVEKAVEVAVKEVLSNAELQKRLPALQEPKPSRIVSSLVNVAKKCCGWIANLVKSVWVKTTEAASIINEKRVTVVGRLVRSVSSFARRIWIGALVLASVAVQFHKPLLIALGVGALIGIGCYYAGPVVASTFSGVAGFAGSLVASAVTRLWCMVTGNYGDAIDRGKRAAA